MKTQVLILLISLCNLVVFSQDEIITTNLEISKNKLLDFPLEGLYNYYTINGDEYFNYTPIQEKSVFYPDIERSKINDLYYRLDSNYNFIHVNDEKKREELFYHTDFRTEFSPYIHEERIKCNDIGDTTYTTYNISCELNEKIILKTIEIKSRTKKAFSPSSKMITAPTTRIVSGSNEKQTILFTECNLNNVFAYIHFICLNENTLEFEIVTKPIFYSDLGLNGVSFIEVDNYNNEFKYDNFAGTFHCFNIDQSKSIGFSIIVYDTKNKSFNISSIQLDSNKVNILPEFNQISIKYHMEENQMNFFVNQFRNKMSQGEWTNTKLETENSADLIFLGLKNNRIETQTFKNSNENLEYVFKENDEFLFIYDKEPQFDLKKDDDHVSEKYKDYFTIRYLSKNIDYVKKIGILKDNSENRLFEEISYFAKKNQKISEGIELLVYFSGEYYSNTLDYKFARLNLDIKKR